MVGLAAPIPGPRYTPEQKSRALAAVERYGLRPAERVLKGEFIADAGPVQQTLITWRDSGDVVILEADREHWSELERQRKSEWQAAINSRRDDMLEAVDQATEDRNYLGMMQSSTAVGIMYDKIVPMVRGGLSVNLSDGDARVQILVTAPSSTGEQRAVDERAIDVEVE